MSTLSISTRAISLALALPLAALVGCAEEPSDPADPVVQTDFAVRVVGELFTQDVQEAQTTHDQIAAGGEADARAAGDFGHDALLGTTLLGTTENEFLGLDRWDDADAMTAFYADPEFAEAFGMLFAAPPNVEMFERQPEWHTWGDMTAGDGADNYFFVVVRGRLAAEGAEAQAGHDMVAASGEEMVRAAGDVAHVVFTGLDDPQEFLAFDIWTDSANIEAVYSDPDFQAAFGALFVSPPTVGVYSSTEWHQW